MARRYLDNQMEMIVLDIHLADPPPVHPTGLVKQLFQADGYFALQHAFLVFGDLKTPGKLI